MKIKKLINIFFIILFFFEPLKASSIQNIINTYFNDMKIEKLNINSNSFSCTLKNNNNIYTILGTLSPLEATIEGNLQYFFLGSNKITENMKLDAYLKNKIIKGNLIFSNYIGKIIINLHTKTDTFDVKNVDIKYICKKLNLNIKNLKGKANIHLIYYNNKYKINLDIKGFYQKVPFISHLKVSIYKNIIKIDGNIKSNMIDGVFHISKNKQILYNAYFKKISLQFFHLIYPFKGIISLKIHNDKDNIIKFKSDMFSGFADQQSINVSFNIPIKEFFHYFNLYNIFRIGTVSGNLNLSQKGGFNFLIEDAILKKDIAKKLKLNKIFTKIFVKGFFTKKAVIFDLLYNDRTTNININKGKLIIDNDNIIRPNFIMTIQEKNSFFKYEINSAGLFLIEKKVHKNPNEGVLIY